MTAVGADMGGQPRVNLYSAGGTLYDDFLAYAANFRGGVRVAAGDVNGDGVADIITAPGAGMASTIKVFSGADRTLLATFKAFPTSYQDGAHVATGNFDADPAMEIVVGRGHGIGQVRIFDVAGGIASQFSSFMAFDNTGVRVAAADFDGVVGAEVIAARAQGAARVKVFGISGGAATLQQSFLTHAKAKTGAFVAAADLNGDQLVEIISGGVEGGTVTVKLLQGGSGDFLDSFTPYSSVNSVRVATGDLNGDGQADTIVTAPGPETLGPLVKRFDALSLDLLDEFFAYGTNGGAFVAG